MFKIKKEKIRDLIVPYKLIFKNQIYEIVNISPKFVIKDYEITSINEKIDIIKIFSPHPNAEPRTGEFCIPKNLRKLEVNENALKMIKSMLSCFNLDDCYFTPWDEIEYEKQEVIGAWKNKVT